MGRLFWKFFLFISLAQLTAMIGVGTVFWVHRQVPFEPSPLDRSPPASVLVESASATLRYGGVDALRALLSDSKFPRVYAVDKQGRDILGRDVNPVVFSAARRVVTDANEQAVRQVTLPGGTSYLLYMPISTDWKGAFPPPNFKRPPDGKGAPARGPHVPFVPLIAGAIVSFIFAALLARHFSKPIRTLRSAFEETAAGNLSIRVGPEMGRRHDELADLGRDFDRMASHLHSLIDGQRRLLHDVSHEMRSPLARLQAAIDLSRQDPTSSITFAERIEREIVRMDRLVGELLTLSRLESGVLESFDEHVDMNELIAGVVEDARFEAEVAGRGVQLGECHSAVVRGSAELIHRALENVVRNAVRHTRVGTTVIVEARIDLKERRLRVQCVDQGPGVPNSQLELIFEPFFRGDSERNGDGHGLGLAIARRVIQAHHGSIHALNRQDGGLCVEIVLPILS